MTFAYLRSLGLNERAPTPGCLHTPQSDPRVLTKVERLRRRCSFCGGSVVGRKEMVQAGEGSALVRRRGILYEERPQRVAEEVFRNAGTPSSFLQLAE